MEKILENLVTEEESAHSSLEERTVPNFQGLNSQGSSNTSEITTKTNTILTDDKDENHSVEEEIDDVMNVLKDLNDVATGTFATTSSNEAVKPSEKNTVDPHSVVESLTSVQDVAKVVDFSKTCITDSPQTHMSASQAADEQCAKLNARQLELEKRFASISTRVNQMRCRMFGSHVADEITKLKVFYEKSTIQSIQGSQSANPNLQLSDQSKMQIMQPSKLLSNTTISRPGGIQLPLLPNSLRVSGRIIQPEGITLPNTPLTMNSPSTGQAISGGVLTSGKQLKNSLSLPTTPLSPTDIEVSRSTTISQQSTKNEISGLNSCPLTSDNACFPENTLSVPSKKVKVDRTKKNKVGKEKITDLSQAQELDTYISKPEFFSGEENEEIKDGLNHLQANLKHLVYSYDSEATESSSGGESCDEFDNYPDTSYQHNQRDRESKLYQRLKNYQSIQSGIQSQIKSKSNNQNNQVPPSIKHRAKWTWLSNRAQIGSKWTWLTAQISDLEYRIRQQNDLVRQIRALKGPVTLGEQDLLNTALEKHELDQNPRFGKDQVIESKDQLDITKRDTTELIDSTGRKIIIREPIIPIDMKEIANDKELSRDEVIKDANVPTAKNEAENAIINRVGGSYNILTDSMKSNQMSIGSSRTRPLKQLRRRCIIPTKGLYRSSARAAKESTVRCDCIHPLYSCAICFGRSNHTQAPDPVFQDRARTISLLDHSYHQVLSNSKSDVPLEIVIMQKLKNRSWMHVASIGSKDQDISATSTENKRESLNEKERRKEERRLKKLAAKTAALASGQVEDIKSKNRKKYAAAKKRKMERELEMELEEEGLITSEISPEELKAMVEERRVKLESKKSKFSSNSNKRRNSEGSNKDAKRKRLKMLANNEKIRRKSVTVHHQADGNIHAMTDLSGNGDDYDEIEASSVTSSSLPSPSVHGMHQLPTMEQIRRKRETAFDIDNIVIPYSTMASARVEKLKYKEIQTPVWRIVDEEEDASKHTTPKQYSKAEECSSRSNQTTETKLAAGESSDIENKTEDQLHTKIANSQKEVLSVSGSEQLTTNTSQQTDSKFLKAPEKQELNKSETVFDSKKASSNTNDHHSSQDSKENIENIDILEDISDILYQNRHAKAEIEEQIRWRTPLWKSSGGQRAVHRSFSTASSTGGRESRDNQLSSVNLNINDQSKSVGEMKSEKTGNRTNQRQDSRSSNAEKSKGFDAGGSLSSGCNTPDPLSPSMVEKVDTLEVNTRPSTPTENTVQVNSDTTVAANIAASIKNRRRTSSATKSRDRNPSEDASVSASSTAAHSRCTTPIEQPPATFRISSHTPSSGNTWSSPFSGHAHPTSSYYSLVEIRPFEPRQFPLSEDAYRNMQNEDHKQVN